MVISAKETLRSIEKAIGGARREEDRLTTMLKSASDAAAQLRRDQAASFKTLARFRLAELAARTTVGRLDTAERRALEALETHDSALAAATGQVAVATTALAEAENKRDLAATGADAADDAVDTMIDETYSQIRDNPAWVEQSKVLTAAEETAAAASAKASVAEEDRAAKGKPYEDDPLFVYLWDRGYGTSRYGAGRIVRFFDGKVANLIGYRAARPNYHMLNEIPVRLREHADRLTVAAGEQRVTLEKIERAALVAAGIEPLEAAADEADETVEDAEDRVEDSREDLARAAEVHAGYADPRRDADLQAALEVLAEEMKREDLASLYREAVQTPSPRDEQVVSGLRDIERKLERREAEAEEIRRTAVDLATRRAQLEQSRAHFRQSGFDDPRGQFADGDIIATAIAGIIKGVLSSGGLDKALRDGFSRRVPRAGGSFGGGHRSRRSRGSRRSGGFSTGGRSGGGGFRTGGGF
ncbi:MAG: hypothetical protein ACTSP2_08580 [Alphaproteobacteria bacterium]